MHGHINTSRTKIYITFLFAVDCYLSISIYLSIYIHMLLYYCDSLLYVKTNLFHVHDQSHIARTMINITLLSSWINGTLTEPLTLVSLSLYVVVPTKLLVNPTFFSPFAAKATAPKAWQIALLIYILSSNTIIFLKKKNALQQYLSLACLLHIYVHLVLFNIHMLHSK